MNFNNITEKDVDEILENISESLYTLAEVNRLRKLGQNGKYVKQLEKFALDDLKITKEWIERNENI